MLQVTVYCSVSTTLLPAYSPTAIYLCVHQHMPQWNLLAKPFLALVPVEVGLHIALDITVGVKGTELWGFGLCTREATQAASAYPLMATVLFLQGGDGGKQCALLQ